MKMTSFLCRILRQQTVVLAVGASVALTLGTYYILKREKRNKDEDGLPEGLWTILNDADVKNIQFGVPAVSTISWYQGNFKQAKKHLETRLKEICNANLWLCGEVRKVKGAWSLVFGESYNPQVFAIVRQEESPISRSTSIRDLHGLCNGYLVGPGSEGNHIPFKLTLIASNEDDGCFAMVVSINHAIADGHTFYMIHNQLSADLPVVSLNAIRNTEIHEKISETIGKEEYSWVEEGFAFTLSVITGILYGTLFRPKMKIMYMEINHEAILEAKKETDGVPYVSTNDILTSWFFNESGNNFHFQVMNMRNRIPQLTDSCAGNYDGSLLYRKADVETPSLIRKSIFKKCRASVPKTNLPSAWEILVWDRMVDASTNWSSFAKPVKIPGAEEDLHIPLLDANFPLSNFIWFVTFRHRGDELGVMIIAREEFAKKFENGKFFKSEIK